MATPPNATPVTKPAGPPPEVQARIDRTLAWVSDVFSAYYAHNPPPLPSRYARREFGFLWVGQKGFLRHVGMSGREALEGFLVREAPHHAYYSTAYYKTPHAATMAEKEWLGADLIFDLDADHLPNGDKMSFEEQLSVVKKEAEKLWDDFLGGMFGFDDKHVHPVFSGGRGYHFHVTDPRVQSLDSAARREIVDVVAPNEGIRAHLLERAVRERSWDTGGKFGPKKERRLAPVKEGGWSGLLTRKVAAYLREVLEMSEPDAVRRLTTDLEGVGEKTARDIVRKLDEAHVQRLEEFGTIAVSELGRAKVLHGLLEKARVAAEGETDEPVTADIKRLIRLPGSLHGKTGLRVVPLDREAFRRFDPLRDAVVLPNAPVPVTVSKPVTVTWKGERVDIAPGPHALPTHLAAFVVLRRAGLLGGTA